MDINPPAHEPGSPLADRPPWASGDLETDVTLALQWLAEHYHLWADDGDDAEFQLALEELRDCEHRPGVPRPSGDFDADVETALRWLWDPRHHLGVWRVTGAADTDVESALAWLWEEHPGFWLDDEAQAAAEEAGRNWLREHPEWLAQHPEVRDEAFGLDGGAA